MPLNAFLRLQATLLLILSLCQLRQNTYSGHPLHGNGTLEAGNLALSQNTPSVTAKTISWSGTTAVTPTRIVCQRRATCMAWEPRLEAGCSSPRLKQTLARHAADAVYHGCVHTLGIKPNSNLTR